MTKVYHLFDKGLPFVCQRFTSSLSKAKIFKAFVKGLHHLRFTKGLPKINSRFTPGLPKINSRFTPDLPKINSRLTPGLNKDYLITHWLPTGSPLVYPLVTHWLPTSYPLVTHWLPNIYLRQGLISTPHWCLLLIHVSNLWTQPPELLNKLGLHSTNSPQFWH